MTSKPLTSSQLISKASVRWLLIGIFLFNTGATVLVAVNGASKDNEVRRISDTQVKAVAQIAKNTIHMDKNTAALQKALTTQCNDRNTAAVGTNSVLDSLLEAVKVTGSLPTAEKKERMALYTSVKVPIINCDIGAVPSQYKIAQQPASNVLAQSVSMVSP
jgi:hypothetical protein